VSDGGFAQALAEASAFSGRSFEADGEAPYGSVVLAGKDVDWPNVRDLGTVC
jgi:hypothetical protein